MKLTKKVLSFFIVSICLGGVLSAQGLKLNRPDAAGGGLVFTNQDRSSNPFLSEVGAGPGIEFFIRYNLTPKFFLSASTGIQTITDKILTTENFRTTLVPTFELKSSFNLSPGKAFKPVLFAGLTAFGWKTTVKTPDFSSDRYYDAAILIGAGADLALNEKLSLSLSGDYRYVFSAEDPKPKFWVAKAGVSFALSKSTQTFKGDEIEYPMDEKEIASLDDLFKETPTKSSKGSSAEEDALSLLFQPEKSTSSTASSESTETSDVLSPSENSEVTEFADADVGKLMTRVQELKNEMKQKSIVIDELQNQVKQNEKAIAELSGQVAGESLTYGTVGDTEFKRKYAAALDKFYMKRYREAIPMFEELIRGNPRHFLSSNCHYWIGESYNGLGDYRKAIDEFSSVMRYKSSYKLDDALIMSGVCYLKIGDSNTAREQFQELVSRYPDSEYATRAMRYLGKL